MRLPKAALLFEKELRELVASHAYWLMLIVIGPLVGHAFITAVRLYAEVSGNGSGPAALPQGLTPLDGILVPTWGAYDLAATLLFPFVAIRLVSIETESGALKLLLQLPQSLAVKLAAKVVVLLLAWLIAWLPGLVAIVLWKWYGGHLYGRETVNLLFGHFLRGLLCVGLAVAAASLAKNAASAAIVTLTITVGTWALDFIAAGRGGVLQQLATFTPTAALRSFEQGLLRLNAAIVIVSLSVGCCSLAVIWLRIGSPLRSRALATAGLVIVVALLMVVAGGVRKSWDFSENRRNSFSAADEAALRQVNRPLKITVYLAPEDPRLTDLEQGVIKKLRRTLSDVDVVYAASSTTGLFESSGEDHYGEIWYEIDGKKVMERSTIEQVVLDQIYALAGITKPDATTETEFSGYPLAAQPRGATVFFYLIWPLATVLLWWRIRT